MKIEFGSLMAHLQTLSSPSSIYGGAPVEVEFSALWP